MIGQYVELHHATPNAEAVRTLHFHEGQVLALGGDDFESIPYFRQARDSTARPQNGMIRRSNAGFSPANNRLTSF
ncbi:MAG: hypothetical protein ABJC63_08520 [Gemmatimonadales bacterium]